MVDADGYIRVYEAAAEYCKEYDREGLPSRDMEADTARLRERLMALEHELAQAVRSERNPAA